MFEASKATAKPKCILKPQKVGVVVLTISVDFYGSIAILSISTSRSLSVDHYRFLSVDHLVDRHHSITSPPLTILTILSPPQVQSQPKKKKDEISVESLDYNCKILHSAWHPKENLIAVAATNRLFLFQEKNNQ